MYSVYESINYDSNLLVNAFVTPIESSTFHWHNEYELLGVLRGSISVHIQSEECLLTQGDLLLINPNEIHAFQNPQKEENLCMILQIKPELFHADDKDNSEIRFYVSSVTEDLKKENIYLVSNSEVTPDQLQFIQSFYKEKLNGLIVPVWFSAVKLLDYENDENIYLAVKVS